MIAVVQLNLKEPVFMILESVSHIYHLKPKELHEAMKIYRFHFFQESNYSLRLIHFDQNKIKTNTLKNL